jgi:hypothetical protein
MPETKTLEISAKDAQVGDQIIKIVGSGDQDVVSGGSFLAKAGLHGYHFNHKDIGERNVVFRSDQGRVILRKWTTVKVLRQGPTAEEKAADETRYLRHRLQMRIEDAYRHMVAEKEALARFALSENWNYPENVQRQAFAAAQAVIHWKLWADVMRLIGEDGRDVIAATVQIRDIVCRDIVERGADDGWSGRGNEMARAVFDAKREWVTDYTVKYIGRGD